MGLEGRFHWGILSRYARAVKSVEQIRRRFERFEPERVPTAGLNRAAVAVVLRDHPSGPELLFIERATRDGDPWSGHMAFPGGRLEELDGSSRAAAERETLEEVGLSLAGAEYVGHLADLQGSPRFRQNRLVVSAHVYHLLDDPGPVALELSEVRSCFWFPLPQILDPERHVDYRTPQTGEMSFPGILVGEPKRHVVWGLTYRFLDIFMGAIESPLPDRWSSSDKAAFRES